MSYFVFNNKKFLDYLKETYRSELTVEKANNQITWQTTLISLIIDSGGKISTRLYDKRDGFVSYFVFNNKKFLDYLKETYRSELTVEKANNQITWQTTLISLIIDSGGKISTRLYDKRDGFDFHIVNFPFLSSNIPSGPSYGVYISQLIRYARCCSHYEDFRCCHKCLVDKLLSQGYRALRSL